VIPKEAGKMSDLTVYFARAMDARSREDIVLDDEKYIKSLRAIGANIINPFQEKDQNRLQDGWSIAHDDLANLKASDIVLADLSVPHYQYVGCIFEIAHAAMYDIPIILVVGERDFGNRVFFQAYCDFIAKDAGEAIEYIRRAHTEEGVGQQMAEMQAYYDAIAPRYMDTSVRTHKRHQEDMETFTKERAELRAVIKEYARGKVCQLGIGTGDWTRTICETASEVVGVEISPAMLVQARQNLSSYSNVSFLQYDALRDDITGGPFDCVVMYFLLSLLPRCMQDRLFDRILRTMKPGGLLIVADTKRIGDLPAIGLGRRQLQKRASGGNEYILYKEHFVGDTLAKLLEKKNYVITASSGQSIWFSWAVSYRPNCGSVNLTTDGGTQGNAAKLRN
jgi:ubiquinone/menaquinone biosynthesis C-methylase UbiE